MNFDLSWLSQEAHNIHAAFCDVFYLLALVLLTLGVVLEYFKLPLGGVPAPQLLVGRVVVAWMMLVSFPEVTNALAGVTDALVAKIGTYSDFERVLAKLGERLDGASFSWTSLKNALILAISYLSFFFSMSRSLSRTQASSLCGRSYTFYRLC